MPGAYCLLPRADIPTRSPISDASPSVTPLQYIRSSDVCRQRKVECDRQQPCSNCVKSKTDCVHPSGRGRAPKRPRRALDIQLADRLSRPETVIRRLGNQLDATPNPSSERTSTAQERTNRLGDPAIGSSTQWNPSSSIDAHSGLLVIDETKSYYVSNILWANLANEVLNCHLIYINT